jgi:formylglycine-generating enzyme required for sulfatase activity
MIFSHPLSNTQFTLNHDGTIQRQTKKNTLQLNEITFVWIPGGCYLMGCGETHKISCAEFESYQHVVCVDGFWISAYEITQMQWLPVMEKNPSFFSECGKDCPVESVNYNEVNTYVNKLNQQVDAKGLFRLPTEAEWEYACTNCGADETAMINQTNKAYSVGRYGKNDYGLYDMTGNVLEMCLDIFSRTAYYYHSINNPAFKQVGTNIVLRGSDFSSPKTFSPCRHRSYCHQDEKSPNIAFRIVWEIRL